MTQALVEVKVRICECEQPHENPDPRRKARCVICGYPIQGSWVSTDEAFDAFFDRFESSHPGWQAPLYEPPDILQKLRQQCQHRERVGRRPFGFKYLNRDNVSEAREEIADCVNYLYLETLKNDRDGVEPEWDVVLEIVEALAYAYENLGKLKAKHRGAP